MPASLSSLIKALCVWRRSGHTCFCELAVQALTPSTAHVQSHFNGLQATGKCRSASPSDASSYCGQLCSRVRETAAVRGTGQHLPRVVAAEEPLPAVILHKSAVLDADKLRLATCAQQLLLGETACCCSSCLGHVEPHCAHRRCKFLFGLMLRHVLAIAGQASMFHCPLVLALLQLG